MFIKMVIQDFLRKKWILSLLFIFIALSALLAAGSSAMMLSLYNSLNYLFMQAKVPHFVQLHAGILDRAALDNWALHNSLVQEMQIIQMVTIDGSDLYLGNTNESERLSVMDIDFVTQNKSFDLLLNMHNNVVQVAQGEIALSVYYQQTRNLNVGDNVKVVHRNFEMHFTIVDFIRDPLMNPAIVHSKRFIIHPQDFEMLKQHIGSIEYLIEFQLTDAHKLDEFRHQYQESNLPKAGPTLDYHTFKLLNALTDGLVIALIFFISFLITIIAILCIRFTILTTIEEDYREIGIMKAIGIQQQHIKKIYLVKYIVLTGLACGFGYVVSHFVTRLFATHITTYLGTAPKNILYYIGPMLAVFLLFACVVISCMFVLRKINAITPLEALRTGAVGEQSMQKSLLHLHKNGFLPVNLFLALQDILQRCKQFRLLFCIFLICSSVCIIPMNFLNTLSSPSFITYMGITKTDMRIDSSPVETDINRFNRMIAHVEHDKDVAHFMPLVTSQFKVINSEGKEVAIAIDSGNEGAFALDYLQGKAPQNSQEIALSYLNSKELKKDVGDHLELIVGQTKKDMLVSGIYQDITNGGRTAKTVMSFDPETIVRFMINVQLKPDVDIQKKLDEYTRAFYPARVSDVERYLSQTLGTTIEQLTFFTALAIMLAFLIALLITFLFLKMLLAKDAAQIAIMKSLGFSIADIKLQYVTKVVLLFSCAILLGMLVSGVAGQFLINIFGSFMGATYIKLLVNPLQTYVILPICLCTIIVIVTLLSSSSSIYKVSIAKLIQE